MPVNQTAKRALGVFEDALDSLQNKQIQTGQPKGMFELEGKTTKTTRQHANNAAMRLLDELQQSGRKATDEEKLILSRYSGKGGGIEGETVDGEAVKGSQYEYYTPLPLANQLWDLLKEQGFDGGSVLDPCAGTGIFSVGMPSNAVMQSVELDHVSGAINGLVNDNERHNVKISPFEKVADETADNSFDAIITNVPFGDKADRGENFKYDKKYQNDELDNYFVKRSIDKLKHGKLAVFIAHTKLLTGSKNRKFRQQVSLRAELVGAYRLPNSVFAQTGADVVTDLLVFRKHSQELTEKIENLYENGELSVLQQARVLDKDIIDGKYYKTEGLKNVLGESRMKEHPKFKTMVEEVVNNDSLPNILKLIRRFPDSRIDLELLALQPFKQEAELNDGDIRVMDGTTYEYQDGRWEVSTTVSKFTKSDQLSSALAAFHNGITYADFEQYQSYCLSAGQNIKEWCIQLGDVLKAKGQDQYGFWLVQLALYEALQKDVHGSYASNYATLTSAMKGIADKVGQKNYKYGALKKVLTATSRAFDNHSGDGISAYWYGDSIDIDVKLDAKAAYENAVYMGRSEDFFVPIEEIRKADPNFDPFNDDDYAISKDGTKVSLNRDYFVGNHGEFLTHIDLAIEAATDPKIKAKLIAQRKKSFDFVEYVDVNKLDFGLRATNIDLATKTEFFSLFGGDDVVINEKGQAKITSSKMSLDEVIKAIKHNYRQDEVRVFFLNRLLDAVNNGTSLTLRANKDSISKADYDLVFHKFMQYVLELDATFASYLKANVGFMEQLNIKVNDPKHKEMKAELDTSPVAVDGFNPKFESFKALQTYQNAEIRRLSRRFEGITGFDVGLGKTMTSIAAVKNLLNIGVKKRTMFVVPSHTISKWYRDMTMTLDDVSDVLVIGSKENSSDAVNSANYAHDLNVLIKKPYRIVLITSDAFTLLPLKEKTINDYFSKGHRAQKTDFSKDGDRETFAAYLAKKTQMLNGDDQVGKYPFFEDLKVDSIVFDEAQMFKNGDASEGRGNFESVKGLSLLAESSLSKRAISAKIKSEYVRGTNSLKDGVVLLSATPITNSPSEILTMLSLAVGEQKAKAILGGASVEGVDDFLSTFAKTESVMGTDLMGMERANETFTGFKNVELLKNALHAIANIQTAKENDLKIPMQDDVKTVVDLGERDQQILKDFKRAYNIARSSNGGGYVDADDQQFLDTVSEMLGEDADLIGHPFNLIGKMQDLILMGSEAVLSRAFFIDYLAEDQALAQKVVDTFNKKPIKVVTTRKFPLVEEKFTKIKKRGKEIGDNDEYEVLVHARLDPESNRILLTANDTKAIAVLMGIAEKNKLSLKPKLSAKLQAMLENFKAEMATPKHNGHAKQIIFCDTLAMHHVIKQALIEYCGVPSSKIAILNAAIKPNGEAGNVDSEDVQVIQDGFAADDFTVVIANKKADTGIDLQIGTQAIHHLTTGWTPDSLQQRNGRGVRQGNKQEKVTVYLYNAKGTFDEYKLQVVNAKNDWISSLMDKDAEVHGTLAVSQKLSDEQLDELIQADSEEAIQALLAVKTEKEQKARIERATKQTDLLFKIAKKAEASADITKELYIKGLILKDYERYIMLMRRENKARDSDAIDQKLIEQIRQEKQSIISEYDAYIPNNTLDAWDSGFNSKANSTGKLYLSVASLSDPKLGLTYSEANKLDETIAQSPNGGIGKRGQDGYDSLQRMAKATKDEFLNYADSPLSSLDREMLFDGTAHIHAEKGFVKTGDIYKVIRSDQVIYGLAVVQDSKIGMRFTVMGLNLNLMQPIMPVERMKAIESFIEYDKKILAQAEVFTLADLSMSQKTAIRFALILDEVKQRIELDLADEKANWVNESTLFALNRVRNKATGRHYLHESLCPIFYAKNKDIIELFNASMDDLVEEIVSQDGDIYLKIPNINRSQIDEQLLPYNSKTYDLLFELAEAQDVLLDFDGVEDDLFDAFYSENNMLLSQTLSELCDGNLTPLLSFDTILTDDQKHEVAVNVAKQAYSSYIRSGFEGFTDTVKMNRLFKPLINKYALDESSNEALLKRYEKQWGGLGRFANQSMIGIAFSTDGSYVNVFKGSLKDRMKDYAESINKRCIWDSRNTRWVVPTEVMAWMLQQDWFKVDQVSFAE